MKITRAFLTRGLICFLAIAMFSLAAYSQSLPPFKMFRSDKTIFSAAELPKTKPVILIYFDPDCDHCQKLMKELFQKIDAFKSAEIIMVTFKPIEEVVAFEKQNNIQRHTNIVVGTEGTTFYVRNYYGLVTMPFTALYDKNGNLKYSYRKETFVDDLLKRLKNL
ncbi:MAG TPA: redoxin domain-containing protein [Chitinophagaceae bacterium]|jgi:thioredoxin-related protein|nr:redoxin domain-containing protein [Chitinophagaceae bacterium]